MYSKLKQMFGQKTPLTSLIEDELYEAETQLLKAQSAVEWANANVTYETARVARLKAKLAAGVPTIAQTKEYESVHGYILPKK